MVYFRTQGRLFIMNYVVCQNNVAYEERLHFDIYILTFDEIKLARIVTQL